MNALRHVQTRALRTLSAAVIGLATTMTMGLAASPATAACAPSDVGKSITSIKASDGEGVLSPTNTFAAWQDVNVEIVGVLPGGGCTGDFLEVTLPAALGEDNATFPILTADGQNMGQMTVTGRTVRMVFNSFVESNDDVQFRGWLTVGVNGSMVPDTTYNWTFGVKGKDQQQGVRTQACTLCGGPITWSRKWAVVGADRKTIWFGIESAAAAAAGEQIVVTDTVDDGQSLQCDSIKVLEADTRDAWGVPVFDAAVPTATVTCNPKTLTVTLAARGAGLMYQVAGAATITAARASYTDNATLTQGGKVTPLTATAKVRGGGANGSGKKKAQPAAPQTPAAPAAPGAPAKAGDAATKTDAKTDSQAGAQSGPQTPTSAGGKGAGQAGKAKGTKGKKAKGKKVKKGTPPKGKVLPHAGLRTKDQRS